LEKAEGEALYRKWLAGYSALETKKDKPLIEIGSYSSHWKVNEAVTYHKGALIMSELEDMIGHDSMREALMFFVEKRKGKPSSWCNLVEAFEEVCGLEVSLWLKDKIST
jgi:hypothetical protein